MKCKYTDYFNQDFQKGLYYTNHTSTSFLLTFKVHVTNKSIFPSQGVQYSVDANIYNSCTLLYHISSDEVGNT